MSPKRARGWILVAGGTILLLLGILADWIGLGRHPGFGTWQWGSVLLGAIALAIGIAFLRGAGKAE